MDANFVRRLIPEVDAGFLKAVTSLSVPQAFESGLRTYLLVLHGFYLQKRDAFRRGAWEDFRAAVRAESRLLEEMLYARKA